MSAVIILLSKSNFYLSNNIFILFIFHENQILWIFEISLKMMSAIFS